MVFLPPVVRYFTVGLALKGSMIAVSDIPENGLALAKLAGLKLAMVLEGMFDTGSGAMLLQRLFVPVPHTRLATALIQVLRSTSCRPGSETQVKVAQQVGQLDVLFSTFHRAFVALADWRNMELPIIEITVSDMAAAYGELLESLRMLLEFLGQKVDLSRQHAARDCLPADFLKEVQKRRAS
jgi:hypothetical protein